MGSAEFSALGLKSPRSGVGQHRLLSGGWWGYCIIKLCRDLGNAGQPRVSIFPSCKTSQSIEYFNGHCEYPRRGCTMQHDYVPNAILNSKNIDTIFVNQIFSAD